MLEISYEIEILAPVCFAEQNSDELLCSTKNIFPGLRCVVLWLRPI